MNSCLSGRSKVSTQNPHLTTSISNFVLQKKIILHRFIGIIQTVNLSRTFGPSCITIFLMCDSGVVVNRSSAGTTISVQYFDGI